MAIILTRHADHAVLIANIEMKLQGLLQKDGNKSEMKRLNLNCKKTTSMDFSKRGSLICILQIPKLSKCNK